MPRFPRFLHTIVPCAGVLILAGCDDEISAYRIAKEKEREIAPAVAQPSGTMDSKNPVAAPAPAKTDAALATTTSTDLSWTAPGTWQPKPVGAMRKAAYIIATEDSAPVELAITTFPGDVGGETANVNRWRGQLGLPPLAESDAALVITRLTHNGLRIGVVDFTATSASPQRILGAMVPESGGTWFFKMTGSDAAVAKAKPAFLEFLTTVKPAASSPLTP